MNLTQRDTLTTLLAFSRIRGLNLSTATRLLSRLGDASNYFSLPSHQIKTLTGIKDDLTTDTYRQGLLREAAAELSFVEAHNLHISLAIMPQADEAPLAPYPQRLLQCDDAPAVLFTCGDISCLERRTIGIVGTRHATAYGTGFVNRLVEDLAEKVEGLTIVSGLAYGIDVVAHRAALNAGIPTAAVFAHGLNTIYPADHRQVAARMVETGGVLVTEYTTSDTIHRGNFLARNRIVAGLCDCLVVAESDTRGGAMSTARIAAAYNREVMALPGRVTDRYSSGCLRLISHDMASVITCADDLISLMQWPVKAAEGKQQSLMLELSPDQQTVLDHIRNHPEDTVNAMCAKLGLPYSVLTDRLMTLEMNDLIISVPGGRYEAVNFPS